MKCQLEQKESSVGLCAECLPFTQASNNEASVGLQDEQKSLWVFTHARTCTHTHRAKLFVLLLFLSKKWKLTKYTVGY